MREILADRDFQGICQGGPRASQENHAALPSARTRERKPFVTAIAPGCDARSRTVVMFSADQSHRTRDTFIRFMLKRWHVWDAGVANRKSAGSSPARLQFSSRSRQDWKKTIAWVFPELAICLSCGIAEFEVPTDQLSTLRLPGTSKPS